MALGFTECPPPCFDSLLEYFSFLVKNLISALRTHPKSLPLDNIYLQRRASHHSVIALHPSTRRQTWHLVPNLALRSAI